MARIFLTHKVKDYDQWKEGYDADCERRQAAGLNEEGHFLNSDDRNSFLIVWDTEVDIDETTALVTAMMADEALAKLMEEAGALEKPEFWAA